jgi:hypothetical protein
MQQNLPIQTQPKSRGRDITINVHQRAAADKRGYICWILRSAIACENRKYNKAKILLSAGLTFSHVRWIHFVLDHPNPNYEDVITYRLCFSAAGVVVEPLMTNPDPEVAPILEMVNLSKVENEFFTPGESTPKPTMQGNSTNDLTKGSSIIDISETRLVLATRMPGIPSELGERPQFRFGGKYLERYGFFIGTPVSIHLEQNKITLTVSEDHQTDKQTA